MKFSQRMGFSPVSEIIQLEFMSTELRNSLWSELDMAYWSQFDFTGYDFKPGFTRQQYLAEQLWLKYFKLPVDEVPFGQSQISDAIRSYFFSCEWYEVYDFIEFLNSVFPMTSELDNRINGVLAREISGYRLLNGEFAPISDENEVSEIEEATRANPAEGVRAHIRQALFLLSDRSSPDYRNSIKESISAVESAAKFITDDDKATLGQALRTIEKGGELHPALKTGFSALYGYTSDASGIRHAMMTDSAEIGLDEAKFFLVVCSAFSNYLLSRKADDNFEKSE